MSDHNLFTRYKVPSTYANTCIRTYRTYCTGRIYIVHTAHTVRTVHTAPYRIAYKLQNDYPYDSMSSGSLQFNRNPIAIQ